MLNESRGGGRDDDDDDDFISSGFDSTMRKRKKEIECKCTKLLDAVVSPVKKPKMTGLIVTFESNH